jgi:glycosyltransferase involved in cell wall biosynthesis
MKISLVVSTRNNLKYLKWSYDSIRKNQGDHEVWICYGIDHCEDGTREWIEEIKKIDPFVKSIENTTGKRLGHTIMYDRIINEIVETEVAMIFHSDMYLCPNALDAIDRLMYDWKFKREQYPSGMTVSSFASKPIKNKNRIVSLTRIEPPLHPSGPEKLVDDFGTEPENFDEDSLLDLVKIYRENYIHEKITYGVFAPWAFWVDEFKEIGGHDPLYAPQSKEDSDIFNRFKLKFGKNCFIQTWDGFVYHLTCRGSRFNPNLTEVGTNSPEWEEQNIRSTRNFIRKWGSMVKHDEYLHPIISHKYNIGFKITNCYYQLLQTLEPWCDSLVCDLNQPEISKYIAKEQPNTTWCDLNLKINPTGTFKIPGIIVEIDGNTFTQTDFQYITLLSQILTDSGEYGYMELGNLKLNIERLEHYENELIVVKNK